MPRLSSQPQVVLVPPLSPNLQRVRTRLLDVQRAATPSLGSSWQSEDLRGVLAGTNLIDPPSVLARDDGVSMLYRGRVNAFFGEPEAGKTLLAQLAVVQEIAKGNCVVYVDYEDSKESAVERLRALGAKDDDIAEYFIYFDAQHPILDDQAEEVLSELIAQRGPVTLAVFDGVTAAMAMGQLDPNDGSDVTRFYGAAPRWFAGKGATVLLLDHVAKDKMGRGRWAIGSERKVSAIDGAAYTLKTVRTFGRGRAGKVQVTIAKDRPGYVRQHEGQGQTIAIFEPRSIDDGKIEVRLLPAEQASEDGSFRRTIYMDRVSKVLETASGPLTARAVRELGRSTPLAGGKRVFRLVRKAG